MYEYVWTANLVEERLQEVAITLRSLPAVKAQGYLSVWPKVVQEQWNKKNLNLL